MKIPRISRRARRYASLLSVLLLVLGLVWAVNGIIHPTVTTSSNNQSSTSIVLNSASATYGNSTSPSCTPSSCSESCTINSSTSITCPAIQLTVGGSLSEAGNYTISVSFTASPAGRQIAVTCAATGGDSCTVPTSEQTQFATGSVQTVNAIFVNAVSSGSGTASVTLTG